MKVCFGLLILFACPADKTVVTSDFCSNVRQEVAQLQRLTPAELAALQRPRKNAIASLRRNYKRLCAERK